MGAPDGAEIEVEARAGHFNPGVTVWVSHPHIEGMQRRIAKASDEVAQGPVIYNNHFYAYESAPDGFGTQCFAHQVKAAADWNIEQIRTVAGGPPMNGYYTWPRLGYDAPLYDYPGLDSSPAPEATYVSDLMATPAGRQWWKDNGHQLQMTFDPYDGSANWDVLDQYLEEKGYSPDGLDDLRSRTAPAATRDLDADGPRLTAEDEAILDRIWDARRREQRHQQGKHNQKDHAPKQGGATDSGAGHPTFTGKLTITPQSDSDQALAAWVRKLLPPKADGTYPTTRDLAAMIGAPDGATVSIYASGPDTDPVIELVAHGPHIETMDRMLLRYNGSPAIYNRQLFLADDAPAGMGTRIFAQQVKAAQALGVRTLTTYGEGSPEEGDMNGYYTWPRLGYDGLIPAEVALDDSPMPDAVYVSDLMATPAGRDWWKANGTGLELQFDLNPASRHWQRLDQYLEAKGIAPDGLDEGRSLRRGRKGYTDLDANGPALTAEDEALLDRLWYGDEQRHLPGQHNQKSHGRKGAGTADGETTGNGTADDPLRTSDLETALKALSEGKHVQLATEREVSTLLDKLGEIALDAKRKGEQAPTYDLCKVSVPGTNLFCIESKGIPRAQMPQLSGFPLPGSKADALPRTPEGGVDLGPEFVRHLAAQGIGVHEDVVPAAVLKASQNELNGAKVAGIMNAIVEGKFDPSGGSIFVTADDYVVDGHHRWAGTVGAELADGQLDDDYSIPVKVIDADILTILDMANQFAADWGIPQASVSDYNAPKTRSWADGHPGCLAVLTGRDLAEYRRRTLALTRHLQGKHNQKDHGRKKGGSSDGAHDAAGSATTGVAGTNTLPSGEELLGQLSPESRALFTDKHERDLVMFDLDNPNNRERAGQAAQELIAAATGLPTRDDVRYDLAYIGPTTAGRALEDGTIEISREFLDIAERKDRSDAILDTVIHETLHQRAAFETLYAREYNHWPGFEEGAVEGLTSQLMERVGLTPMHTYQPYVAAYASLSEHLGKSTTELFIDTLASPLGGTRSGLLDQVEQRVPDSQYGRVLNVIEGAMSRQLLTRYISTDEIDREIDAVFDFDGERSERRYDPGQPRDEFGRWTSGGGGGGTATADRPRTSADLRRALTGLLPEGVGTDFTSYHRRSELNAEAHRLLAADNPARLTPEIVRIGRSLATDTLPEGVTTGIEFVASITDASRFRDATVEVAVYASGSSSAAGGVLHVREDVRPATVAHELGHIIDERNDDVRRAGLEFLRTTEPSKLFDEYSGKVYPDGTHEALATAVERLYADPIAFAARHPEQFDFALAMLQPERATRSLRHQKGKHDQKSHGRKGRIPTPDEQTIERVLIDAEHRVIELADYINALGNRSVTVDDIRAEVLHMLTSAIDESEVAIRRSTQAALAILDDGRFKTLFETGTTGGANEPDLRKSLEQWAFGIPKDAPPGERPVYGYLRPEGDAPYARQYGEVSFILDKAKVRERATVSMTDAAYEYQQTLPTPMADPDLRAFGNNISNEGWRWRRDPDGVERIHPVTYREVVQEDVDGEVPYFEVHVHGGVTLDDIARVEVDGTIDPALAAALDAAGIPYTSASEQRHLAGKHDQKSHGRKGSGSDDGVKADTTGAGEATGDGEPVPGLPSRAELLARLSPGARRLFEDADYRRDRIEGMASLPSWSQEVGDAARELVSALGFPGRPNAKQETRTAPLGDGTAGAAYPDGTIEVGTLFIDKCRMNGATDEVLKAVIHEAIHQRDEWSANFDRTFYLYHPGYEEGAVEGLATAVAQQMGLRTSEQFYMPYVRAYDEIASHTGQRPADLYLTTLQKPLGEVHVALAESLVGKTAQPINRLNDAMDFRAYARNDSAEVTDQFFDEFFGFDDEGERRLRHRPVKHDQQARRPHAGVVQ